MRDGTSGASATNASEGGRLSDAAQDEATGDPGGFRLRPRIHVAAACGGVALIEPAMHERIGRFGAIQALHIQKQLQNAFLIFLLSPLGLSHAPTPAPRMLRIYHPPVCRKVRCTRSIPKRY